MCLSVEGERGGGNLPDNHVLEREVSPPIAGLVQLLGPGKEGEEVFRLSPRGGTVVDIAGAAWITVTGRDVLCLPFELITMSALRRVPLCHHQQENNGNIHTGNRKHRDQRARG